MFLKIYQQKTLSSSKHFFLYMSFFAPPSSRSIFVARDERQADASTGWMVYGHSHRPGILRENDMWLHNLGLAEQFSTYQVDLTCLPGNRVSRNCVAVCI